VYLTFATAIFSDVDVVPMTFAPCAQATFEGMQARKELCHAWVTHMQMPPLSLQTDLVAMLTNEHSKLRDQARIAHLT